MFRVLIVWLLCLVTLAAANDYHVNHYMEDEANLFETAQGYAMNAPTLAENNIRTVSVNGNNVVLISQSSNGCQESSMTKQELAQTRPDLANTLFATRNSLKEGPMVHYSVSRVGSTFGGIATSILGDVVVAKYGENISMKKPGMPNDINRFFSDNDVVTCVFNNNKIKMIPFACLDDYEKEYVQQIRAESDRAISDTFRDVQNMAANDFEVNHHMEDEANLFETAEGYAMNAPILANYNIETVSVNGNNVVLISQSSNGCVERSKTKQQLEEDMPVLADTLFATRNSLKEGPMVHFYFGGVQTILYSGIDSSDFTPLYNMAYAVYNGNISMRKPGMPNDISRIFANKDVVTYVFKNNEIKMKPFACLQPDEERYVHQIINELAQIVD